LHLLRRRYNIIIFDEIDEEGSDHCHLEHYSKSCHSH